MLYLCFTPLKNRNVTASTVPAPHTSAPASPPDPALPARRSWEPTAGPEQNDAARARAEPPRVSPGACRAQALVLPDTRLPVEESTALAPAARRGPGTFSALGDCGAGPGFGGSVPLAIEDELGALQCFARGVKNRWVVTMHFKMPKREAEQGQRAAERAACSRPPAVNGQEPQRKQPPLSAQTAARDAAASSEPGPQTSPRAELRGKSRHPVPPTATPGCRASLPPAETGNTFCSSCSRDNLSSCKRGVFTATCTVQVKKELGLPVRTWTLS